MKSSSALILLSVLASGIPSAFAGEITGTVTLKGTPPAERPITYLKEEATCGKLVTDTPTTHFYVVGPKGELADTVIMLKNVKGQSTGASAAPALLDQKGCQFTPQILAIQTGQKLLIRNSDPTAHNVHSKPSEPTNKEENQLQGPGTADLSIAFPTAEPFLKFQCDVHSGPNGSWMLAWVTVVDSPYFAVTGKDGTYKISNVPPGKYTIVATHRKASQLTLSPPTYKGTEQEIEVKESEPAKADFTFEVPAAK